MRIKIPLVLMMCFGAPKPISSSCSREGLFRVACRVKDLTDVVAATYHGPYHVQGTDNMHPTACQHYSITLTLTLTFGSGGQTLFAQLHEHCSPPQIQLRKSLANTTLDCWTTIISIALQLVITSWKKSKGL
jgi:hypothetical protein